LAEDPKDTAFMAVAKRQWALGIGEDGQAFPKHQTPNTKHQTPNTQHPALVRKARMGMNWSVNWTAASFVLALLVTVTGMVRAWYRHEERIGQLETSARTCQACHTLEPRVTTLEAQQTSLRKDADGMDTQLSKLTDMVARIDGKLDILIQTRQSRQ
jgi:hypothetical protein